MAFLLGLLGAAGGTAAAGGLADAASAAAPAAGALGGGGGGGLLSGLFGGGGGSGGAPPLPQTAPLPGPGGTGSGTGSGIGPMLPTTPNPSVGEMTQIPGLFGQTGASPTTPMSPMPALPQTSALATGGGSSPLAAGGGASNFWQSPFGQYLGARYKIGPQAGLGGMNNMNPMLTAVLGRMTQPAYSAAGMGNPFTFNPSGPQFQA